MNASFLELNKLSVKTNEQGRPELTAEFTILTAQPLKDLTKAFRNVMAGQEQYLAYNHTVADGKLTAVYTSYGAANPFLKPFLLIFTFKDYSIWHSGPMPAFDDGWGERIVQVFGPLQLS